MRAFLMVKLYAGIKCFVIRVAVSYPVQEKKRNYWRLSYSLNEILGMDVNVARYNS